MSLPSPPPEYSTSDQAALRDALRRSDQQNLKRGQDIELGAAGPTGMMRIILTDAVDGRRYALRVTSGILGVTALPAL